MSLENVKLFYARLAIDENLRTQVQNARTRTEGQEIARAAGFDFTPQEFEDYTTQILEGRYEADDLPPLADKELAAVVGGFLKFIPGSPPQMIYGSPWPDPDVWLQ